MPSTNEQSFLVGLTGGIASGKTTVANSFADLGVPIVDTDLIAREVVLPGAAALTEIGQVFGGDVIADDGTLDRNVMRSIVFSDDGKRAQLEAILHPRIRDEAFRMAAAANGPYVIIVVPLLVESPMKSAMDRILVVDCSVEVQLERLLARDRETIDQARRIIAAQASREERLSIADDVIENNGALSEMHRDVKRLHEQYLALATKSR